MTAPLRMTMPSGIDSFFARVPDDADAATTHIQKLFGPTVQPVAGPTDVRTPQVDDGSPIGWYVDEWPPGAAVAVPHTTTYCVQRESAPVAGIVLRHPVVSHARDTPPKRIAALSPHHPAHLTWAAIRWRAWQSTTFYPNHDPRQWEYPVIADIVRALVSPNGEVVDVGAGVSPLAPYLHHLGLGVDTVDPSALNRGWPPHHGWNEWDFLDYGAVDLARESWNSTLQDTPAGRTWDVVVSVSVIEHLPAATRRELIDEIARRTRPGGHAVLTVDIERGTDRLWNRNRGRQVDVPHEHGTTGDITSELVASGLTPEFDEVVRNWGDEPVDIGLYVARKSI